jgi:hypothetical protein
VSRNLQVGGGANIANPIKLVLQSHDTENREMEPKFTKAYPKDDVDAPNCQEYDQSSR